MLAIKSVLDFMGVIRPLRTVKYKVTAPARIVTWLGIQIDKNTMSFPEKKIQET